MVVTTSMFIPGDYEMSISFRVSTLYRPIVPDNEEALLVFQNDEHTQFIFEVSKEKEENSFVGSQRDISCLSQERILNIKSNHFPKDLVSLESSFTRNDGIKMERPKDEHSLRKVQETKKIKIETIDHPRYLNLGVTCLEEETL